MTFWVDKKNMDKSRGGAAMSWPMGGGRGQEEEEKAMKIEGKKDEDEER